jgi:hypothetical protein
MSSLVQALIVAAFSAALGVIISYIKSLNAQFKALQLQVAKMDVQISPLWARVQAQIAADLHHPHPRYAEMDTLLESLDALTITPVQRDRLKVLLAARAVDMHADISEDQRKKASIMIAVMDLVVDEAKAPPATGNPL